MASLQGLIFDVDGTIANTERDGHRIAFNEAFREAKLDWYWSEELYGELLDIAGGQERIIHYVQTYCPEFEPPAPLSEFALQLHEMKMRHYPTLLADGNIPLRPGVERLLKEARDNGIPLAIATTSALPNVVALLEHTLGIESLEWFEVIAAGNVVPHKKPAPDVYFYVLEKMGWSAENCLVIEDSNQGLTAARGAGLRTLITYNSYTCSHNFDGAWIVLDHLGNKEIPCSQREGELLNASYVTISGLLELMTPKRSFYEKWFSLEKTPFARLNAS
jgi:HAD superfamily hydrolase (TIGR01509 family)